MGVPGCCGRGCVIRAVEVWHWSRAGSWFVPRVGLSAWDLGVEVFMGKLCCSPSLCRGVLEPGFPCS